MLVYVWSRRNPMIRMNFFGLITFQAPYLPWVLLAFSLLLGNSVIVDLMGTVTTIEGFLLALLAVLQSCLYFLCLLSFFLCLLSFFFSVFFLFFSVIFLFFLPRFCLSVSFLFVCLLCLTVSFLSPLFVCLFALCLSCLSVFFCLPVSSVCLSLCDCYSCFFPFLPLVVLCSFLYDPLLFLFPPSSSYFSFLCLSSHSLLSFFFVDFLICFLLFLVTIALFLYFIQTHSRTAYSPNSFPHLSPGIAVGHVYYFLEDILPYQAGGFRCLKTPELFKLLFDDPPEDPNYHPLPDDERPGGFNWGGGDGPEDDPAPQ